MCESNVYLVNGIDGVPNYEARKFSKKKNKVALLIPVLNEGPRLILQLAAINKSDYNIDIIIADGGSEDSTVDNIEKSGLPIRAFLKKEGKGALSAQLRMGFHFCLSEEYESVITMDGNNKDDPSGIESILKALNSGIDFVQGSRFIVGGQAINTPVLRYLAIRFLHAPATSFAAKYWFTDTTNGFRGHSEKLLRHSEIEIFRNVFETYELLAYIPIRSSLIGLRITEVPVIRSYPKGEVIPTKIHGLNAQMNLLRILANATIGKYNPVNNNLVERK